MSSLVKPLYIVGRYPRGKIDVKDWSTMYCDAPWMSEKWKQDICQYFWFIIPRFTIRKLSIDPIKGKVSAGLAIRKHQLLDCRENPFIHREIKVVKETIQQILLCQGSLGAAMLKATWIVINVIEGSMNQQRIRIVCEVGISKVVPVIHIVVQWILIPLREI